MTNLLAAIAGILGLAGVITSFTILLTTALLTIAGWPLDPHTATTTITTATTTTALSALLAILAILATPQDGRR